MPLLFDEDYTILKDSGLDYKQDEGNRFLVIENYPLPPGFYVSSQDKQPLEKVAVLLVIPSNYNTSGCDMLWVHPALERADGKIIPNVFTHGKSDARFFEGKEYCRWSRHFGTEAWSPKNDNIQKILDRVEWALRNPDANK